MARDRVSEFRGLPIILLLVVNVGFFTGLLVLRSGAAFSWFWDVWAAGLVLLMPPAACFARAFVGGPRRTGALWLGFALVAFAVGSVTYLASAQFQTDPAVPSVTDIAYLAFYPCVIAAVIALARQDIGKLAKGLWLDAALGAAGAATAMAAVLSPALSGGVQGDVGVMIVSSAFSVGDLVIFAMICGLLAVRGARGGSMWLWLAGGLAAFCAADVGYALLVSSEIYVTGGVLRFIWAMGITLIAVAVWRPERPRATDLGRSTAMLAVPTLATLTAVVVLVISSVGGLSVVAVALATFTLLLAAGRTFVSFRQVQRLSDAHRQAVTDELTGLGNRRYLFEFGEKRLQASGWSNRIALILIDLDNFKEVNDTLGHHAGDQLLCEAARRLAARVSDPDLLVRLGGDEFALVITLAPGDNGNQIAERILDRLTQHFVIDGVRVRVEASAGVAESGDSSVGIADLLRRADVAMYAAKRTAARVELYAPQLDEANRTRLETIQDLDAALLHDQFVLHYQPKMDVKTGAIVGAEALVRWEHPTRGMLYPDAFLPAVEESGLMSALTGVVLDAAIRQLATWHRDGLLIAVAVNLSASDLLDEGLAGRIERLLAEHGVPVSALELEITESVLMTDPQRAREVLEQLRRLGLRIAVDDYGTGYCALAYLRDLPIDELKIDRSFIAHITADPRSAAIVHSTIELAHALDLKVVGEGVEEQDALTALVTFGCDYAQGYHFSRPLTADAFADWAQLDRVPAIAVP